MPAFFETCRRFFPILVCWSGHRHAGHNHSLWQVPRPDNVPAMPIRPLALALSLALALTGCTYKNKPLNRASLPEESRRTNGTRAALAANVPAIGSTTRTSVQPATTRATTPSDHNHDGVFFGIAISGG